MHVGQFIVEAKTDPLIPIFGNSGSTPDAAWPLDHVAVADRGAL
jgi:hypothetical protein